MAGFQLVVVDARNAQPVYLVGGGAKYWINDGNVWGEILKRLDECEGGTKPSPWDGIVWRRFDNGNPQAIASYGKIVGDRPPGVDEYGR